MERQEGVLWVCCLVAGGAGRQTSCEVRASWLSAMPNVSGCRSCVLAFHLVSGRVSSTALPTVRGGPAAHDIIKCVPGAESKTARLPLSQSRLHWHELQVGTAGGPTSLLLGLTPHSAGLSGM
jgi:hypothetical protein